MAKLLLVYLSAILVNRRTKSFDVKVVSCLRHHLFLLKFLINALLCNSKGSSYVLLVEGLLVKGRR